MGVGKMGANTNPLLWFLGCFLLLGLARGAMYHYDYVVQEKDCADVFPCSELCTNQTILTVDGTFPGPDIYARKGDTVFVTVHNEGPYGLTIHWHGVTQQRNPWSDGPENVTQCPIPHGESFTQEVDLTDAEGTLWWHAHSDWSRATVHGAIIVYPANGTHYPFTQPHAEKKILLASWYKTNVMDVIEEAIKNGGEPNVSDAYTINGKPGDSYECTTTNSTERVVVEYGKTYLLRIINAVLNEEMFFGIANHSLTLVAQDAQYTKQLTVDWIMITPGQTMDVLFTANQTANLYYMVGSPFADAGVPYNEHITRAIVEYKGDYSTPAAIPSPTLPAHNDTEAAFDFVKEIKSLASPEHPISVPGDADIKKKVIMAISFNTIPCPENTPIPCLGYKDDLQSASLNNISFWAQKVDVLSAYYRNLSGIYTTDFPDAPLKPYNYTGNISAMNVYTRLGTKAITIEYGEGVEFIFQGTNMASVAENHPMHLHGYNFYVVGKGFGNYNASSDPDHYNRVDPPYVNTIGVPKNGWVAIRFKADNPGVWFMHCHLERHATWGMATVVIVKNGPTNETSMRGPPEYMPPCSP